MSNASSQNPVPVGRAQVLEPQPCSLIIFGGVGDLSRRKLLPGVFNLFLDKALPANFAVLGFGRRKFSDEDFRNLAHKEVKRFSRRSPKDPQWSDFQRKIFFSPGSFEDKEAFKSLKKQLEEVESRLGIPGNRVFYLAIPPSSIELCLEQLKGAGLINSSHEAGPFSRVIVEKPVGRDLRSARHINDTLSRVLEENQIFRIDHYLGKETVQNIMVMRFANSIFEPLWNRKYIDHVQITVAEEEGVGTRGGYYEEAGALRDMVQNHILQLLSLIAMEPPWSMDPEVIRDHRLEVLNCMCPISGTDVDRFVVRAQYGDGAYKGTPVPAYRREERVKSESVTETYVALKVFIDNWRWAGVPFYLRTGKRMPKRFTEIAVQFKEVPPILFNKDPNRRLDPNVLTLRIQPDEGMSLRISTKIPGSKVKISPVKMDFRYGSVFGGESPGAYERLLLDVMAGDATLFMRRDAVEISWEWITPILEAWEHSGSRRFPEYKAGSWGPLEADRLIESDHRKWRTL